MPSVVRSTVLLGALALAATTGLTACGDKVNVQQVAVDSAIHTVTVTPSNVPMNVGDKVTLAASVDAGPGAKVLTVTWTSSNTAVATVDANGTVTAVAGGNCTIIAAATADPSKKGSALVTVGAVVQPTVTISTINQTTGAGSVPAVLGNVIGQLDVTLNVDPGTQKLSEVDLVATVGGKDTVVQSQTLATSNVAPVEAASAPITLSFNTASFNTTTGAVAFTNGNITIKGVAKTTSGTQTASGGTVLTLNNADALVGSVTLGQTAQDVGHKSWSGKSVVVAVVPVLYTAGRTAATTSITLTNDGNGDGVSKTQTLNAAGAQSATYTDGNGAGSGATDIDQITNDNVYATATVLDNNGISFGNSLSAVTPCIPFVAPDGFSDCDEDVIYTPQSVLAAAPKGLPSFRLDTRKPLHGNFHIPNSPTINPDQGIGTPTGYVGAAFKFTSDSSSGYRGPDSSFVPSCGVTCNRDVGAGFIPGVGKVTVAFAFRTGSSGSFTTVTDVSTINESVANNTYTLRQITTDALGNADTSTTSSACGNGCTFGVDKTPPTVTVADNPANQATDITGAGVGSFSVGIGDALSGPGTSLAAQVRNWNGLSSVNSGNEGWINTNAAVPGAHAVGSSATSTQQPCYIGRFNATQAAAGPGALPVFNAAGTAVGFCTPVLFNLSGSAIPAIPAPITDGYWATTLIATDAAGNQATGFTRTILEDVTAPTIANIDPPATAVGNGSVAFPANVTDNAGASVGDVVGSFITQTFSGLGVSLQFPTSTGPGVAFDNVLTNAATATPTLTNYIKNLQAVADSAGAGTTGAIAAANNNTSVQVTALGAAGNSGSLVYNFQPNAPQFINGSANTWPCPQTSASGSSCAGQTLNLGWTVGATKLVVTNCPAAGCSSGTPNGAPLSTTLVATAGGPSLTFVNPLQGGAVSFWYRTAATPAGVWYFAGNGGPGIGRDGGLVSSGGNGHRMWDYSLSFDPPAKAPGGEDLTVNGTVISIMAIGVAPSGDAITNSVAFSITTANP